jgi:hypothetical protein
MIYRLHPPPEENPPLRCHYCRWPGVPPDNAEPDRASITYTTLVSASVSTGTKSVEVVQGVGCPLCGSPLFRSGGKRNGMY